MMEPDGVDDAAVSREVDLVCGLGALGDTVASGDRPVTWAPGLSCASGLAPGEVLLGSRGTKGFVYATR